MHKRTSIVPGIVIGSITLVFVVAITVGWNVIFPFYYSAVYAAPVTDSSVAAATPESAKVGLWLIMAFGDIFLVLVILAIAFFLTATIRRGLHIRRQLAFIDTITHELKTPLTSLSLSVDAFRRRNISEDLRDSIVIRMDQDIKRLSHFIQHVLDANRIEHGDRVLSSESINLGDLLRSCCIRIQERYQLTEDAICHHIPDQAVFIQADSVACETILLNLIDNAVKYSGDHVAVSCELHLEDPDVVLRIRDKGIGIQANDLKHIFERFTRVSQQSKISGSGLGLYLVKQLCKRMQMQISAASQPENGSTGSVFTLRIPPQILVDEITHEH